MLLGILTLMLCLSVRAQQKTITGKVRDADNRPMPGVTVSIKNKKVATTTKENGVFSIVASPGDDLVFSSVGYDGQDVKVGADNTVSVTLDADGEPRRSRGGRIRHPAEKGNHRFYCKY